MSYSKFLSKAIKESNYSQQKISILAKSKYNVDITPSYISKLQSGKKIASAEINEALAKVCKVDVQDLQFEADFEKAPLSVQKAIYDIIDSLKDFLANAFKYNEKDYELFIQAWPSMSTRQKVEMIANSGFNNLNSSENDPFNSKMITDKLLSENDILNNLSMEISMNYKMNDGSMLPLIQENAKLILSQTNEIQNGNIVLVEENNGNLLVRFYNKIGNTVSLIPMNSKFDTIQYDKDKMIIRSVVTGYIVNI